MTPHIGDTAAALVNARLRADALSDFPGALPETLDEAYAIQLAAIALWPDAISGWKVGRLTSDLADRYGQDRFIGPIFRDAVRFAVSGQSEVFAAFSGGSAMFEAEYVVYAARNEGGEIFADRMTTGIEVAASPIATLPVLGSLATIADLGNNAGQIIGAPVPIGRLSVPSTLVCTTCIGTADPIHKTAESLPGGPATAFAFAVAEADRIGLPLQPGQFVSTGAVTGMHPVQQGQDCSVSFGEFGRIACIVTARKAVHS